MCAPRLIILAEFVDSVQNSTGYYWSKIIAGLAEEFGEIWVICPSSSYVKIAKPLTGVRYFPFKDLAVNRKRIFSRGLGQFIRAWHFFCALISKVKHGDVVFCGTNPAILLVLIALLKRFVGFRWLLLVHDVFPENMVPAKLIGSNSIPLSILQAIFGRAYSSADTLIAIGRDMVELLERKIANRRPVVYIPNWVDPDDISPLSRDLNPLFGGRNWSTKCVFQFFGTIGRVQGLSNVLAALPLVRSDKAAFAFIGSGAQEHLVEAFLKQHPNLNIARAPGLPFSQSSVGLSACDVAVVSLAKGMIGLAVPSKAYFSLAADRPLLVISDEGSELHRLLQEETSLGWFCQCDDPPALARLIDMICETNLIDLRGRSRGVLCARFPFGKAIEVYSACIRELAIRQS